MFGLVYYVNAIFERRKKLNERSRDLKYVNEVNNILQDVYRVMYDDCNDTYVKRAVVSKELCIDDLYELLYRKLKKTAITIAHTSLNRKSRTIIIEIPPHRASIYTNI